MRGNENAQRCVARWSAGGYAAVLRATRDALLSQMGLLVRAAAQAFKAEPGKLPLSFAPRLEGVPDCIGCSRGPQQPALAALASSMLQFA